MFPRYDINPHIVNIRPRPWWVRVLRLPHTFTVHYRELRRMGVPVRWAVDLAIKLAALSIRQDIRVTKLEVIE